MAKKRLQPNIEEEVLVLSRRRCCICYGLNRDLLIKSGQIAHLDGNRNNNALANLAYLCFEHHDQYDTRTSQSKGLTPREVRRFRKELYEIIDKAWKQPIIIAGAAVRARGDITGRYVRETENESAEIEVTSLTDGRIHVSGVAFWGIKRKCGPNIGQIDFETTVHERRATFTDKSINGEDYKLDIVFEEDRLIAKEQHVVGYFGMNASFDGEYNRV